MECSFGSWEIPFQEEGSWEPLVAMQPMWSWRTSRACDPDPGRTALELGGPHGAICQAMAEADQYSRLSDYFRKTPASYIRPWLA